MSSKLVTIQDSKGSRKKWYRSPKVLRHAVMAFFFLFLLHVAYDHQVRGGGPNGTPSVEAYCPFGGLESVYQFLTTGGFVRRIQPSALILFAALLLLTLLASRGFCGWICPFGSLQEWLGLLGKKIFRKRFNPTGVWDRWLRYLKYLILAAIIGFTWHLGTLVFREYDPFLAFFHLGREMDELPWAYAILGVVLLGSLWIERFFCKYACPLGAVIGLIGKLGLSKVQRDPTDCKACNVCHTKCPIHVEFLSVTTIRDAECNHCMDCVVDCPKPNVLSLRGLRWRFSHPAYAAMLVLGLFALIGTSQLAAKWQTKPETIEFAATDGTLDAENIRGWMTLEEISTGYGIEMAELYRAAGVPQRVLQTARINTISKDYGIEFEPDAVREAVRALLAGEPSALGEAAEPAGVDSGEKKHDSAEESDVKGFMTLNEIEFETGVPKEFLLEALGAEGVDARRPVREWMHDHGASIQDLREAVDKYRVGAR